MTPTETLRVTDGGVRLDRFLANHLRVSRTQIARLIADRAVTVNGKAVRASYLPEPGDEVQVTIPEEAPPREIEPHPIRLDVVFEDDHLLVVDKPAGLVVHPAPGHWQDTLVNALVARGTDLPAGTNERRGIVHRLDMDTSGLMIVAKTTQAHRRLGKAMERRKISRVYAALVWGHLAAEPTLIEAPLGRHPRDRKRMTVRSDGRAARTLAVPVARFDLVDLVRLELETGRTHQIRVHLAHVGHPVLGDPVYGGGGARRADPLHRPAADRLAAACPRQALHAARLRFRHPATGEDLTLDAGWPEDLKTALALAAGRDDLVDRSQVLDYLGFFQRDG